MPDHLTGYISIPKLTVVQSQENDRMKKIEALEANNFELRNQVTRLTLHNATLRRMLKLRGQPDPH